MSSSKDEAKGLPEGWVLCTSKSNPGRNYYFNKKTGRSSWTQPQADDNCGQNKEKSKKEKAKKNEKLKKAEAQKKATKRKSDGNEGTSAKKKNKSELPSPEKHSKPSPSQSKTPVPKVKQSPYKFSPPKTTPTKNLANNRLSQLRARLSAEAEQSERDEILNKHYISPKVNETPPKINQVESKSPVNESKCSTTNQSPSSDSIQSIPSPSQFLAANKIISSMKAQLPEKYCDKTKQKDTFADIEQGICNQTAEYPFMKHPSTPPQFSEASKLVSAIKSKLSYKGASKEGDEETFQSAQDRMNMLRSRLCNETVTSENDVYSNHKVTNEAMDVDQKISQNPPTVPPNSKGKNKKTNVITCNGGVIVVVDTNVFIHELDFIRHVYNSYIKGYKEQPTFLVPWRVVNELDRLKDNNNGNGALCKRAKSAMDFLYQYLPNQSDKSNKRIIGQPLRDASSHIYPCEMPDDEILNCCLQQAEKGEALILLTNDKNLCNKAVINNIQSSSVGALRALLTSPRQHVPPDADLRLCRDAVYSLLATVLENEMQVKFNNLWQNVLFKLPPWTLDDVLQCLSKHWMAVFNEVFPRAVQHLIPELRNCLISLERKDPKSISRAEVTYFQELCLDIAKKCQIIPEYMDLAKLTVERIENMEATKQEVAVVDAFEELWGVFSGYCVKLSSELGIPHNIEVNQSAENNESLPELLDRFESHSHHIREITDAVHGIISATAREDSINRLTTAIKESLTLSGLQAAPTANSITTFCDTSSNMLQEAYTKFALLVDVLDACQQKFDGN